MSFLGAGLGLVAMFTAGLLLPLRTVELALTAALPLEMALE